MTRNWTHMATLIDWVFAILRRCERVVFVVLISWSLCTLIGGCPLMQVEPESKRLWLWWWMTNGGQDDVVVPRKTEPVGWIYLSGERPRVFVGSTNAGVEH